MTEQFVVPTHVGPQILEGAGSAWSGKATAKANRNAVQLIKWWDWQWERCSYLLTRGSPTA